MLLAAVEWRRDVDGAQLRNTLLEVVREQSQQSSLQSRTAVSEAARRLRIRGNLDAERALLAFWGDLFRLGYLAWGHDLSNQDPPFCHLTELGRQALAHYSRDPANSDGYLAYLASRATLDPVSQSYVEEAVHCYNATCFRAAAVMVGVSAERIILKLRDRLTAHMISLGQAVPRELNDWRVKKVLDALEGQLAGKKHAMPRQLAEAFEALWPAFTFHIRSARNEAGHPADLPGVTAELVHGSLLIFPELAALATEIDVWIPAGYS